MRMLPVILIALLATAGCKSTGAAVQPPRPEAAAKETAGPEAASPGKPEAPKAETPKAEPAKPAPTAAAKSDDKPSESDADKARKEAEAKEKKEREDAKKKYDGLTEKKVQAKGLFTVWSDESNVLLELEAKDFGREFLYHGGLRSGAGSSSLYRGAMLSDIDAVLRLERRGEKSVMLIAANDRYLPGGDSMEERMRREVLNEGLLHAFPVAVELKDEGKLLIDVGAWLNSDSLQVANRVGGKFGMNKDLSRFEKVQVFPRNIEISHEAVLLGGRQPSNSTLADGRGLTVRVHHSFTAPPDPGYKPRLADQRVGYFITERKDLFDWKSNEPVVRYINRWRLQKKDPTAEVSDPVVPITFWVENSTPKEWRAAAMKAIEFWEPAFRKAGFSNAIVGKQMPDDADWHPADVRYSVLQWSNDENVGFAIGPSRTDPRTGEIYDADITMQANFVAIYRQRFETWVQQVAGKSKPELLAEVQSRFAVTLPEDYDLDKTCRLAGPERMEQAAAAAAIQAILLEDFDSKAFLEAMVTEVLAHEVGHTLGLRHNFKSSTFLDLDSMADAQLTAQRGLVGSVMDYTAINIAAPGKKQGEYFQTRPGPYDMWAIEYGYSEFAGNEKAALAAIASKSNLPGHDYGTDEDMILGDPLASQWDLGKDPVAFARTQLELAETGLAKLAEKGAKKGEPFVEYSRFYGMFASLYSRNYSGLDRYLWGVVMNRDVVGQADGRQPIRFVDPAVQRDALDVLVEKGLRWTGGIPDEQRLLLANRKFGSFGRWFDSWSFDPLPRIVNATRYRVLASLLTPFGLERLSSQSRLAGPGAVTPAEVTGRVHDAVWASDAPDEHDRWTQADCVDLLMAWVVMDQTPDLTALYDSMLTRAQERAVGYSGSGDAQIAAHGSWLNGRIERFRNRQRVEIGF